MKHTIFAGLIVLTVGACAGPKEVAELRPVLDPLVANYSKCLSTAAGHYARTVKNAVQVRKIADDLCEGKRRAIESALFDHDAKEDQAREYMRGVHQARIKTIASGIQEGRAKAAANQ